MEDSSEPDRTVLAAAAMPKVDTAAWLAAAMPKVDTAAWLAAAMPKFKSSAFTASLESHLSSREFAGAFADLVPKLLAGRPPEAIFADVQKLVSSTPRLVDADGRDVRPPVVSTNVVVYLAILVLLLAVMATIELGSPEMSERVNRVLGPPLGIAGLLLGLKWFRGSG